LDPKDPITVSYKTPFPGEPTGKANPELLRHHPSHGHDQAIVNGISRIGYMKGGKAALWKDEDMADVFTRKAVDFLARNRRQRFFLSLNLHDVHVPRIPHPRFVGKTRMGARGDALVEADWSVGEVLKALDRYSLAKNTLVLFSSDNGPVLDDGYQDGAVAKVGAHKPAGPWRGAKVTAYEGGTRVPFLARLPGVIPAGRVSDALLSHVDFAATFAALTGQTLAPGDAPDSVNVLPALLGQSPTARDHLVEQGGSLALREGNWKYIATPAPQLYNLTDDPAETTNVLAKYPVRARAMAERLQQIRGQ
jgi:arylsulfatase A-like enzyme